MEDTDGPDRHGSTGKISAADREALSGPTRLQAPIQDAVLRHPFLPPSVSIRQIRVIRVLFRAPFVSSVGHSVDLRPFASICGGFLFPSPCPLRALRVSVVSSRPLPQHPTKSRLSRSVSGSRSPVAAARAKTIPGRLAR